jgi:DNA polymerase-1
MKYFIIDAMNMAYRAHNVHFESKTSDGTPSGMFYGFLSMLQNIKKRFRGYKFIVVWDNKATWKYEIHPDYKSNRTRLSPMVKPQIGSLKEYLRCCNVDQYEKEGQEADDVIASLVEKLKSDKDTEDLTVYSNDKDLLQLVENGKVIVFKPKVGKFSPEKFYDREAVVEKFGVPPEKLVEFRCFDKDTSDTIEGVSRVRRKKIAACINKTKNLDEAFVAFQESDMSDNEKDKMADFREQAKKNYKIMKLLRNLEGLELTEGVVDTAKLKEMLDRYEIKKIKPDLMAELFQSSLNVRYTDARPAYTLESFSLFDE